MGGLNARPQYLLRNRVQIAPSILSADFAHLGDQIRAVERGGASLLHLDVMDGHFVPNITIGPPVVASVRKATALPLDCHLMISEPDRYVRAFADAGADMISVHQEACIHLDRTLAHIRSFGAAAGAVINPATPVETLTEVLECVDYVLVMSVNPGFGGQEFIPRVLDKIRRLARLRDERGLEFLIEIDGGVSPANVLDAVKAGVDIVVAGSSVFHSADPAAAVELLLKRAGAATLSQI
jgi:ribulose-phosphate 3-epimerase